MENNIAEVLLIRGRFEDAALRLEHVLERTSRVSGFRADLRGYAMVNLSRMNHFLGQERQARQHLEQGTRMLRGAGARGLLAEASLWQAEFELETNGPRAALRILWPALLETHRLGRKLLQCRGLRILGRIARAQGRPKIAEVNLRRSARLAEHLGADYEKGKALLALAEVYGSERGSKPWQRSGRAVLKHAATIFRRLGAEPDLESALRLRATFED